MDPAHRCGAHLSVHWLSPLTRSYRQLFFSLVLVSALISRGLAAPQSQLASATLVVCNRDIPESKELAEFYASSRSIPASHIVELSCSPSEYVERVEYDRTIAEPLRKKFEENGWWKTASDANGHKRVVSNQIRFVVLMRGIPLKINEAYNYPGDVRLSTEEGDKNEAAVDSEVAALGYYSTQVSGTVSNPYYRSSKRITDPGVDPRMMVVARLDGPDAADVRRMIKDSLKAENEGLRGRVYIDARGITSGFYATTDGWLHAVARAARAAHQPVVLDDRPELFPQGFPMIEAIIYFGWYSEQVKGVFEDPSFRFKPGAIAVHIQSGSAATVRNANSNWVGPLIKRGAAASLGNVTEPRRYIPELDIFYDRLLAGWTFGESAYDASPVLSWMYTYVGDPLYRPFAASGKIVGENKPKR
jgi:uncharacterized protein (TIGR03790 family)